MQSVVRDAEIGRRHADKLVKVGSLEEEAFHVMIHIEVQSDKDLDFTRRMYVYNYRIFDNRYLPVTSLAILAMEMENHHGSLGKRILKAGHLEPVQTDGLAYDAAGRWNKKIHCSAIQSNDIDTFRKTLEEIAPDQPEE